MSVETGAIRYGRTSIGYQVLRSDRRTLAIEVHPDGRVWVRAPRDADEDRIQEKVINRSAWIRRQQRFFEQFRPRTPARAYVPGESHLYLGRRYRLKRMDSPESKVVLKRGYLEVRCLGKQPEQVKAVLRGWLEARAAIKLRERFAFCLESFPEGTEDRVSLTVRRMKRRWGSHAASGRITIHVDLIQAPVPCIDYVLCHELCHALHPHHGRAFWKTLTRIVPDWRKRKERLEQLLSSL